MTVSHNQYYENGRERGGKGTAFGKKAQSKCTCVLAKSICPSWTYTIVQDVVAGKYRQVQFLSIWDLHRHYKSEIPKTFLQAAIFAEDCRLHLYASKLRKCKERFATFKQPIMNKTEQD